MIDKVAGVSLIGGFFEKEGEFKFYDNDKFKVALTYGKNGSGKSSISKAIYELSRNNFNEYSKVELFDFDHKSIEVDEKTRNAIHVYNENYINSNLRLQDDGLDTIVMLGEQLELDDTIQQLKKEYDVNESEIQKNKENYEKISDPKNILSPEYYKKEMITTLKGENGWAAIDASIKFNKKNSSVNANVIESIAKEKSDRGKDKINKEFMELHEEYIKATNSSKNNDSIERPDSYLSLALTISDLLETKIDQPIINEHEKIIMNQIQNGDQKFVERAKKQFSDNKIDICPFCLQEITQTYKEELVKSINQVLNKEVDDHINQLKKIELKPFEISLESFENIDKSQVRKINELVGELNTKIEYAESKIKQKIENVYQPISEELDFSQIVAKMNEAIEVLENKRRVFNENIDKIKSIHDQLIKLNKQKAWYSISSEYNKYKQQQEKLEEIIRNKEVYKNKATEILKKIEQLEAKKKNVSIALETMNNYLEYIFFEKGRLKLEVSGNQYRIISRNNPILLKNLSLGERNAIALCYFFSKLQENYSIQDSFKEQLLILLDDPISSFDIENKIGIYSFLRSMINKIVNNNSKSKVLVFTHEIEVMYHFEKVCKDIDVKFKSHILANQGLDNFNPKKYNEYTNMMKTVYKYANQEEDYQIYNNTIGNTMRRVLEAFGTFSYKKGIDKVSCDTQILGLIDEEKKRAYFENLMYRLVLNTESHSEEATRAMPELDFYSFIGETERVRTAKDVLCFIYLLNPLHILSHLDNGKWCQNVKAWCENIS